MLFFDANHGIQILPTDCNGRNCLRISQLSNETEETLLQSLQSQLTSKISAHKITSIKIGDQADSIVMDQFPATIFSMLPRIVVLESSLQFLEISTDDFTNATELRYVTLSHSKLRKFSRGKIQPVTWDGLTLDHNEIDTIEDFTFANFTLWILSLESNKLTKINRNTFSGLSQLTRLYLSENQIQSIHPDAFIDLKDLEILRLNNNKLKTLDDQVFKAQTKLNELYIDSNGIETIGNSLTTLTSLERLSLKSNPISDIDLVKFAKLSKLEKLDLEKTGLDMTRYNVSSDEWYETQLFNLNLASNNITTVESLKVLTIFPILETLNLSGNDELKKLNLTLEGLKEFLSELKYLDL